MEAAVYQQTMVKDVVIYKMKYYSANKRMKFCHLHQQEWTRRTICSVKCQRKTNHIIMVSLILESKKNNQLVNITTTKSRRTDRTNQ